MLMVVRAAVAAIAQALQMPPLVAGHAVVKVRARSSHLASPLIKRISPLPHITHTQAEVAPVPTRRSAPRAVAPTARTHVANARWWHSNHTSKDVPSLHVYFAQVAPEPMTTVTPSRPRSSGRRLRSRQLRQNI